MKTDNNGGGVWSRDENAGAGLENQNSTLALQVQAWFKSRLSSSFQE
jgi:hypothetical protein